MQRCSISNTGIAVSQLGLGTVKFGRNQGVKYPTAFNLPDDQTIEKLLDCAQQLGINLLDTAPAYGSSEERLGQLLRGKRQDWVISTKAGEEFVNDTSQFDFSAAAIQRSIERSLLRLQTDYLDIVLIHSNGADQQIIMQDHVFDTLAQLKQAGKIRAYGMSTKTLAGGLATVEQADVVMIAFNPAYPDERSIIHHAQQHHKAVFIKKALASGHLQTIGTDNPVKTAMEFIFAEPGVSSVIVGTLSTEHLTENAKCIIR